MSATVLVVDDEEDILMLCRMTLEVNGFTVVEATTGREALAAVGRERPDVVVLDLRLPDVDGWEVLERLRADPGLDAVPVIACSAHASSGDRALASGCAGFVSKPFRPSELVDAVHAVLSD